MALTNITAAHAADAIKATIAGVTPRNSNPLKNKTIHADIRVQRIDDDDEVPKQSEAPVQLVEQSQPSIEDAADQERDEEMRSWWNNEMKKHMNQPDGYEEVSVLLIKWADNLDELKTRKEAEELDHLFRTRFHYHTKTAELNVRTKCQYQLNCHVGEFIRDHDGPNNLLIIYYTGHGSWNEDKRYLELTASTHPASSNGFSRDARANWNKVEAQLRDEEVEGDVLTILDTCYASNLVKKSGKQQIKKFELVAASPIDTTTASPGQFSFTRALIDGLKTVLDEKKAPVSTFRLVQNINLNKARHDTPAHLWAPDQTTEHHIFLAPLKPHKPDITKPSSFRHTPGGYLTLRLGLRDASLNKEQIEFMTKSLSSALFNKQLVGLRKVEWLEMKRAPPIPHFDRVALVMFAVTQWKKAIHKRKQDRESQLASQRTLDQVTFPEPMEISPTSSQKRQHEDEDNLPNSKRPYLDSLQPPSPPVSTSSRIES